MLSIILLSLLASFAVGEIEVDSDGVLVLTTENFNDGLDSADFVLVEFYAPWCGHCKALAPEYGKAAKKLAAEHKDVSVKLAKVDATVETTLAKEQGVRGYPTIKFFKKNNKGNPIDFNGGRTESDIVSWLLKKTGPPATEIKSVDAAKAFAGESDFVVVGLFNSADDQEAKAFLEVAESLDGVKFGVAYGPKIKEDLGAKSKIVIHRKFDEPILFYDGDCTCVKSITAFIRSNQLPYVIEFSDETAPAIFGGDVKTHALLFCKKSEADLLAEYKNAAKQFKGKVVFIHLDTDKESNSRVMEFFNLKAEDGTQLRMIIMGDEMDKFKADLTTFNERTISTFANDVLEGKIKKHLMTENIPDDWDKQDVKVLVGKNFEDVVLDKSKDVLVEFYAPWCGHCKALAPIYEELGAHYKGSADKLIAKMDATKNEIDLVKVQGFPTIVLFRKDDNKIIYFNGGRTLDELKHFVDSRGEADLEEPYPEEEGDEEEDEGHDEL